MCIRDRTGSVALLYPRQIAVLIHPVLCKTSSNCNRPLIPLHQSRSAHHKGDAPHNLRLVYENHHRERKIRFFWCVCVCWRWRFSIEKKKEKKSERESGIMVVTLRSLLAITAVKTTTWNISQWESRHFEKGIVGSCGDLDGVSHLTGYVFALSRPQTACAWPIKKCFSSFWLRFPNLSGRISETDKTVH